MENYFSEISRVLKQGGRCFITYFLLNRDSIKLVNAQSSTIDFKYKVNGYRIKDPDIPEAVVAYDEKYIRELYEKNNLQITPPIHYGSWYSRKNSLSYQDIIVAVKKFHH